MRCISRSTDCQQVTAGDAGEDAKAAPQNTETTAGTGVSSHDDAACQHLTVRRKVEAAGIEPASRNISTQTSTCVVDLFKPSPAGPQPTGYQAS